MKRTLTSLLVCALGLAGCGRSPDPLEWRIDADDPTELQTWLATNLPLMPARTARELRACISNIQITLPPARTNSLQEQTHKLCARLDGKTVRAVLIEGNELSHNMLLARAKNLSDELISLMGAGDGATEEQRDRQLARAAEARLNLQEVKQQLDRGQSRLAELRAAYAK